MARPDNRLCRVAPALILVGAGLALGFAAVESREHGWLGIHRYGAAPGGLNWAQLLPRKEGLLYLALLWLVPLAVAAGLWLGCSGWWRRLTVGMAWKWRRTAGLVAVVVLLAALGVSHLVLNGTPLTDDENAYLFQARIFSLGSLTWPSPPHRELFDNRFIINDGRWYSQYPPGHPALLVPGVLVGDPWLVPAAEAAVTVFLLAWCACRLFGRRSAAWTAVLAASSPFLIGISATLLSHISCLMALTAFLAAGIRATSRRASPIWAGVAALLFGLAVLIRPFSACAVGLPLIGLLIVRWRRCGRPWRAVVAFAGGGLAMLMLQLWLNWRMNGNPFFSGYVIYWFPRTGWRSPFGFGSFPWGMVHTPALGLANLWHNMVRLNAWLLGWPVSLVLVFLGVRWTWRRFETRWLTLAALFSPLAYVAYFWPGVADVGPVLLSETMVALLVLAGVGIGRAPVRWRTVAAGWAAASVVLAGATFHRAEVAPLRATAANARAPFEAARAASGTERAAVLVPDDLGPFPLRSWFVGRPQPWPDLRDRVLFLRDVPGAETAAPEAFPNRRVVRLEWSPETGFRLIPALSTTQENGPPSGGPSSRTPQ